MLKPVECHRLTAYGFKAVWIVIAAYLKTYPFPCSSGPYTANMLIGLRHSIQINLQISVVARLKKNTITLGHLLSIGLYMLSTRFNKKLKFHIIKSIYLAVDDGKE